MIKAAEIKLPFGLNKHNSLVHIANVESGKSCNCVCPFCRCPLIAVKGKIKQHHFRHEVDSECARNPESAIHLAAKKMIMEKMQIKLPKYVCFASAIDSKGKVYKTESETVTPEGKSAFFDSVEEEKELDGMVVDILAMSGNTSLIIEIYFRHKVDDQKREKIINAKKSALEIDLSDLMPEDLEDLEKFWLYINDPKHAQWLYNAKAHDKYYPKHRKQLDDETQAAEERYKQEEIRKLEQQQREKVRRQKQEQKEKPELLRALEELKKFRSMEHIVQLNQKAETHPAWKLIRTNNQLSLNEIPDFLNVDVPDGDWIFGCDRRIWQAAIYYTYFINCKSEKNYFSIRWVDQWLQYTAGCKVPHCAKIVGKYGRRYHESVPTDVADNIPSTWRTLRAYFKHLDKLWMLEFTGNDRQYKGSFWYTIINIVPESKDDLLTKITERYQAQQ